MELIPSGDTNYDNGADLAAQNKHEAAIRYFDKAIISNPANIGAYCKKAESLLALGKYDLAEDCCLKAASIDPKNVDTFVVLARSFAARDNHWEAVSRYAEAVKLDPTHASAYSLMGESFASLGDFDKAMQCYADAIRLEPDLADAYKAMGNLLAKHAKHKDAVESYAKFLRLEPNHAETHQNRGISLAALGDHDRAVKSYEKSLRLDPSLAETHKRMGISLAALGDHDRAVKSYEKSLRLDHHDAQMYTCDVDRDNISVHYIKGVSLAALGYHNDAIACFDVAIISNPSYAHPHIAKGKSYVALGNHEAAIECFDEVLKVEPDNADAVISKIFSIAAMGDHREAVISYDEVIRLDPDNADAHRGKGESLAAMGDHREAVISYDEVIRLDPDNADAHRGRGTSLAAVGDHHEALKCLNIYLKSYPVHVPTIMYKGSSLIATKNYREAVASYEAVIQLDPDNADAHRGKGESLAAMGDHREAVISYDEVIRLDPDNADAHRGKGESLAAMGDHAKALDCYNKILSADLEDKRVHVLRGVSFKALGREEEARASFILGGSDYVITAQQIQPNVKNDAVSAFSVHSSDDTESDSAQPESPEYDDTVEPVSDAYAADDAETPSNNNTLAGKLKEYQNRLLNISGNNRCIRLARISSRHNFDLASLDMERDGMSEKIIQHVLRKKSPICVLPDSDEDTNQTRTHLKTMHRNIRSAEDETGTQYCYVGFPFLEGRMAKGYPARAPLALFPVSVSRDTNRTPRGWYLTPNDSEPIPNRALFAALEKIGGFQFGEQFELDFEDLMSSRKDKGFDLVAGLANLLSKNGIPVESEQVSNDSHDRARIHPWRFGDKTKDELERIAGRPFKIKEYKIVGSFPQGESAIYKDYDVLIDTDKPDKFMAGILDADPNDPKRDDRNGSLNDELAIDKVPDRDLNMVLPSDSSQDAVVLKSQSEQTTLVRGPPGTGKSQVIVNIISNALSKKQTVLVVCQKRAALDVVQQRLAEVGLDKRAVLLNKEKEDRAKTYTQILDMLNRTDQNGRQTWDELTDTSKKIDRLISSRAKITDALYDESFGGIPVQRLYAISKRIGKRGRLELDSVINGLTFNDLQNTLKSMSEMEQNYKKFETDSHPWFGRKDFASLAGTDEHDIEELLSAIKSSSENCLVARDPGAQQQLVDLIAIRDNLSAQEVDLNNRSSTFESSITAFLTKAAKDALSVRQELNKIERYAKAGASLWTKFDTAQRIFHALDHAITEKNLQEQQRVISALSDPSPSFFDKFNREKRKNAATKREFLARHKSAGHSPAETMSRLDDGLKLQILAEDLHTDLQEIRDSIVLSDRNEQDRLLKDVGDLRSCMQDLTVYREKLAESSRSLSMLLQESGITAEIESDLKERAANGKSVWESVSRLSEFFKPESNPLRDVVSDPETLKIRAAELLASLPDFEDLRKHDSHKKELDSLTLDLLKQCSSCMEAGDDWGRVVEQEVCEAWIEAAEAKHPVLRQGFDSYAKYREDLQDLVYKKSRLVARRIVDGPTAHTGEKRSRLQHELEKRKRIKPVRKLIEEFRTMLFDLVPCWLASPEAVSNIFPMEKSMFDMVIVDEASQLAAERAMPFLYRGERKVIAGDENQLKPHDLFQMQDEESEDVDEILSIESLLDLAKRRHPTRTLQWHYRSQWQQLIDFSNHAFYKGQLHVAPNVSKKPPEPPISWIDCDGVWENRANQIEAEGVVDKIYRILQDAQQKQTTAPTLGVIAFNVGQRDAILDAIEARQDKDPEFARLYSLAEHPESQKNDDRIFIRNIENVQGDEREIIIFSVGYAKDPDGKLRMQFGSLNKEGGENRLNVAITRASKKIMVLCSFDPNDMTYVPTNNGPRFLKSFLLYARAVSRRDDVRVKQILDELNPATARRGVGTPAASEPRAVVHDSVFEEMVYVHLRRHGYEVDAQVGQSGYRIDLAIVHPQDPGRYILGVECDGAQYHSAKSARDRDVYRQKFLERRGWVIARIWSRDWWRSPAAEIEKIRRQVDTLMAKTP